MAAHQGRAFARPPSAENGAQCDLLSEEMGGERKEGLGFSLNRGNAPRHPAATSARGPLHSSALSGEARWPTAEAWQPEGNARVQTEAPGQTRQSPRCVRSAPPAHLRERPRQPMQRRHRDPSRALLAGLRDPAHRAARGRTGPLRPA